MREVEPPGEQRRERRAAPQRDRRRSRVVADQRDADRAGVEALRVRADHVARRSRRSGPRRPGRTCRRGSCSRCRSSRSLARGRARSPRTIAADCAGRVGVRPGRVVDDREARPPRRSGAARGGSPRSALHRARGMILGEPAIDTCARGTSSTGSRRTRRAAGDTAASRYRDPVGGPDPVRVAEPPAGAPRRLGGAVGQVLVLGRGALPGAPASARRARPEEHRARARQWRPTGRSAPARPRRRRPRRRRPAGPARRSSRRPPRRRRERRRAQQSECERAILSIERSFGQCARARRRTATTPLIESLRL